MSSSNKETNKTKNGSENEKPGGRVIPQFIKYRLSEKQLEDAKNAADTYQDVGEIASQLIDEGYKFSASRDTYGGGYQVFITPNTPDNPNLGFTLSARAPSLIAAVAVLCYKHYTLFSQDWPKEQSTNQGANWG